MKEVVATNRAKLTNLVKRRLRHVTHDGRDDSVRKGRQFGRLRARSNATRHTVGAESA